MTVRSVLLGGAMAITSATIVGGASAQNATPPTGSSAPAAAGAPNLNPTTASPAAPSGPILGEVVVTARRREESLQKVPEAITAFSEQKLREQSISSVNDLNKAVPGLTVESGSGNPGIPTFAIRGRGQNYGAAAGSVETYFADVPLSGPFQAPTLPAQLFDLQSLEVLKGPQGTLFGRSTTGGAVLLVPQAPTYNFGGYARLQGGTYGDFQAEGAINIPIVDDKIALRLSGFEWQRDGYSHTYAGTTETLTGETLPSQSFNNRDETHLRASLLLQPTDKLTNTTILSYSRTRDEASAGAGLFLTPGATGFATTPQPGYGTQYSFSDVRFNDQSLRTLALINTTTYEISSNLLIKNIFGYIAGHGEPPQGANDDGSSVTTVSLPSVARTIVNHQFTDELQFQGDFFDKRLTYIAGFIGDLERQPLEPDTIPIISFTPVAACGAACYVYSTNFAHNNIDSFGAFGSVTYKLTDKLRATAGYRHSWDNVREVEGTQTNVIPQTPNASSPTTLQVTPSSYRDFFQGNAYSASLDYAVTPLSLAYGGYRRGYKRGGFNQSAGGTTPGFAPETVDDFYIGTKNTFRIFDRPARLNIEGYYDLYHGQQVSYLAFTDTGQITTPTTNVNASTYRGVDVDFTYEPTRWLTFDGNYGYIDAFNTKWIDTSIPGSTVDLAANPIPFVSRNKVTITARLHADLPNDKGELALAPTVSYQDAFNTYTNSIVSPLATQYLFGALYGAPGTPINVNGLAIGADVVPSYTLVDLRLEWNRVMGSRFNAAFNATNLTNKNYMLGNSATITFGAQGDAYGPPRLFTFEVSTKF